MGQLIGVEPTTCRLHAVALPLSYSRTSALFCTDTQTHQWWRRQVGLRTYSASNRAYADARDIAGDVPNKLYETNLLK